MALECDYLDIQKLNQQALTYQYDLIKVSAAHIGKLLDRYQVLTTGGALGLNCGPLLISKNNINPEDINNCRIFIPGINTTAKLLFDFAFPDAKNQSYVLFSDIEERVLNEEGALGVIIHENRFTYAAKGLICIKDLGQYWVEQTGLPIPLGVIMIRKSLSNKVKESIKNSIQKSISTANSDPQGIWSYIKRHATELDDSVIRNHINLYVNRFSVELGLEGMNAVRYLLNLQGYKNIQSELFF